MMSVIVHNDRIYEKDRDALFLLAAAGGGSRLEQVVPETEKVEGI
jgi:hypothetical protein